MQRHSRGWESHHTHDKCFDKLLTITDLLRVFWWHLQIQGSLPTNNTQTLKTHILNLGPKHNQKVWIQSKKVEISSSSWRYSLEPSWETVTHEDAWLQWAHTYLNRKLQPWTQTGALFPIFTFLTLKQLHTHLIILVRKSLFYTTPIKQHATCIHEVKEDWTFQLSKELLLWNYYQHAYWNLSSLALI